MEKVNFPVLMLPMKRSTDAKGWEVGKLGKMQKAIIQLKNNFFV